MTPLPVRAMLLALALVGLELCASLDWSQSNAFTLVPAGDVTQLKVKASSRNAAVMVNNAIQFFFFDAGLWSETIKLSAPTTQAFLSVDIADTVAAVGVKDLLTNASWVRVYTLSDSVWSFDANISMPNALDLADFGASVAVNDVPQVIVTESTDLAGTAHVYVYDRTTTVGQWATGTTFNLVGEDSPAVCATADTVMFLTSGGTMRFELCAIPSATCVTSSSAAFPVASTDDSQTALGSCVADSMALFGPVAVASCSADGLYRPAVWRLVGGSWVLSRVLTGIAFAQPFSVGVGATVFVLLPMGARRFDAYSTSDLALVGSANATTQEGGALSPSAIAVTHADDVFAMFAARSVLAVLSPLPSPSQEPTLTPWAAPTAAPSEQWVTTSSVPLFAGRTTTNGMLLFAVSRSGTTLAAAINEGAGVQLDLQRRVSTGWASASLETVMNATALALAVTDSVVVLGASLGAGGFVANISERDSSTGVWAMSASLRMDAVTLSGEFSSLTSFATSVAANEAGWVVVGASSTDRGFVLLYARDAGGSWQLSQTYSHASETGPSVVLSEGALMYITSLRTIRFEACPLVSTACAVQTSSVFMINATDRNGAMLSYCGGRHLAISAATAVASCSNGYSMAFFSLSAATGTWRLDKMLPSPTSPVYTMSAFSVGVAGDRAVGGSAYGLTGFFFSTQTHQQNGRVNLDASGGTFRSQALQAAMDDSGAAYFGLQTTAGAWQVAVMTDLGAGSPVPSPAPTSTPPALCPVITYNVVASDGGTVQLFRHKCVPNQSLA